MTKPSVVLGIDGNFYLHRVFHTSHPGSRDPGDALAYSFLGKVCADAVAVRATHVVVAFDGDEVFRYSIFPDYKGQRSNNDDVYEHLPRVLEVLTLAGIPWVHPKEYEADDVLCTLGHRYGDQSRVVLGTRDKDAYQYLRPNVSLYDSSFKDKAGVTSPRYITHKDVETLTGMPPSLMVQYQALVGDKVDNIPAVLSPAKARNGLLAHRSINAWCAADPEVRKTLKSDRKKLMLNRELVTMKTSALPKSFALQTIKKCSRTDLPKSYYAMLSMLYPKSRGLF